MRCSDSACTKRSSARWRTKAVRIRSFHEIRSEPTEEIVEEGRKAAVRANADCIVALGGGSVLDSAKIIAAGAKHPRLPIRH
ncbi:MAG: iron-containing alcohol dehydrogenase, partial [Clostridia bacterium]|nr:iron-containing alcohol dehydrogenase [Clostridia bacterium]